MHIFSKITSKTFTDTGRIVVSAVFILWGYAFLGAQDHVDNHAFETDEYLSFELKYKTAFGEVKAGKAQVKIKLLPGENNPTGDDRQFYHVVADGKTNNFFDLFFKVRDHFESFMDASTLLPERFINHSHEGNYVFCDDVTFDRENGKAVSLHKEITIPANIHDILSSVYFLRTLSLDDFGPDSIYSFSFFLDDSVYLSRVIFLGRETLETQWGPVPCLKIKPMVATGNVFARNFPVIMWVTDDKNHVPMKAESEIIVGSVVLELVDYRNLKNPFIQSLTTINKSQRDKPVR